MRILRWADVERAGPDGQPRACANLVGEDGAGKSSSFRDGGRNAAGRLPSYIICEPSAFVRQVEAECQEARPDYLLGLVLRVPGLAVIQ